MVDSAILEKLSSVRTRLDADDRVSLSEFARGRAWRSKLAASAFMELQEHGERMAWIVSEAGMRDMLDYISDLELQAQRSSIRAMADAREGFENWQSGSSLESAALDYFRKNEAELVRVAAGD
jgi:hypothetical protein